MSASPLAGVADRWGRKINPIPGMTLVYGSSVPPSTAWRDFPILSPPQALNPPQK
jgi:hypothetical protein